MGIHPDRFVFSPITQDIVDLGERALVVAPIHLVGDGQVFVGMDVMKGDRACFALGGGALQALAAERNKKSGDAAATTQPGQTEGQRLFVRDQNRHVPTRVKCVSVPRIPRQAPQAASFPIRRSRDRDE